MSLKNNASLKFLVFFVLIAVIAFGSSYAASNRQNKTAAADCPVEHCVALTAEGAKPNEIYVKIGASVQFNSADGKKHELSLGKGGEEHNHNGPFHSGEFKADEAWRTTFSEAGTIFFHDHYNPDINVLVVVYGADAKVE